MSNVTGRYVGGEAGRGVKMLTFSVTHLLNDH